MRLILDTNVLIAGLRSRRGASYELLRMIPDDRFELNVSAALALEYEAVLRRTGMAGMRPQHIDDFLDYLLQRAQLEPSIGRLRPVLHEPDDERILELAAQCGAIIVTYNVHDFEGAGRVRVKVKTPAEVLTILRMM